jgi:hypothetical protein
MDLPDVLLGPRGVKQKWERGATGAKRSAIHHCVAEFGHVLKVRVVQRPLALLSLRGKEHRERGTEREGRREGRSIVREGRSRSPGDGPAEQ